MSCTLFRRRFVSKAAKLRARKWPVYHPQIEQLLERIVPTVIATYDDSVLKIELVSDDPANEHGESVFVSRWSGDTLQDSDLILVNGRIIIDEQQDHAAAIGNTGEIQIFGTDFNDTVGVGPTVTTACSVHAKGGDDTI